MNIYDKYITFGNSDKTPTLLLHANAYNPYMYEEFISYLGLAYVIAPLHRPLWDDKVPHLKDWNIFMEDLIIFMDQHNLKKINAIGHSLGAIAIMKASVLRPDLFNKIVLIDPVMLPEEKVRWVRYLPFKLKVKLRPIIKIASLRRNHWPSREDAHKHLISKSVFKKLKPSIFDTFINKGIVPDDKNGGFKLAFPREWEAMIYASPENIWKFIFHSTSQIAIIKAEHSDVISQESWQKLEKLPPNFIRIEMPDVAHLIPFEKPDELARLIIDQKLLV
ncbi:MAG TPA: alpha/beta hydrolase [Saprospiraceae bacterium]|nr:alpha/beta hydrolase [Saprospiraceae bacterium]